MSTFKQFNSPAFQATKDLAGTDLTRFSSAWNQFVTGWTESSIIGNPWSNHGDAPRLGYFNPIQEGLPSTSVPIKWNPFPNRLSYFLGQPGAAENPQLQGAALTASQIQQLADHGQLNLKGQVLSLYNPQPGQQLLKIPGTRCPEVSWSGNYVDFAPYGPRGWQDEYCEWSIARDANGKMRSIMFTCENPAYYLAMWQVNPESVLAIYRNCVDSAVQLEDLYLRYPVDQPTGKQGDPVIDPTTGRPAYDVTNKWNCGPVRTPGQAGGAVHLTSPPNTLSAEIYLAAAGTIQRPESSRASPQALICCAKYGQNYRNSDPQIGFNANKVAAQARLTLTDPVGLYLQQPASFAQFKCPDGLSAQRFWKVTRGTVGDGPNGVDQILHAVFEVPAELGFAIDDITVGGQPLTTVGVLLQTMQVALSVTVNPPAQPAPPSLTCVGAKLAGLQPAPGQLIPLELFYGNSPTDLATFLAPGSQGRYVLVVQGADSSTTAATARVSFDSPDVTVKVVDFIANGSPIPGLTDSSSQVYVLDVQVAASATAGPVQVRALNPSEPSDPSADQHPWSSGLAIIGRC